MKRVLRFFINLIYCFVICIGISLLQVGLFDLTAAQSSDVQAIHIAAPTDESVGYFDTYAFWATDISTNFKQDSKHRVRNWVNNTHSGWWKNGMRWLDTGIDFMVGFIKPIIVPIAQVNAIRTYYGYGVNEFDKYLKTSWYDSEEAANNAIYELYVVFEQGYGEAYTVGEEKLPIAEYEYTGKYLGAEVENPYFEYERWIVSNKQLYNCNWRLNKYNSGPYEKYFKKFIIEDESGARHIKTAVVAMYYQQIVSIVISIVFVCKFPINLFQYDYAGKGEEKTKKKKK